MAYNYLGLTNDVALRLNETQLTANNFSTSTGFYSAMKEGVNARYVISIKHTFSGPTTTLHKQTPSQEESHGTLFQKMRSMLTSVLLDYDVTRA